MKLKTIVEQTKQLQTLETLTQDLRKLGLYEGDTILVHVSLSQMGWILGGAETLYHAIYKVIGSLGTIIVPTQTGDNSDPKDWKNPAVPESWHETIRTLMPPYDKKLTATRSMGAFSEFIRNHPNALRSNHPQVSFAALGFHAKKLVKTHVLTPKFGLETPLGTLYQLNDAKILMIGTDITTSTGLHLAEVLSSNIKDKEQNGCAMYVDNKRQWVTYEDKAYDSDRFLKVEEAYLKVHKVNNGLVGQAPSKLYLFNKLIDFAVKVL